MERIIYRKTLDVQKTGTQFTLQGFETADRMARRIEISLMADGDTLELPNNRYVAAMYVTSPTSTEPSINHCVIEDNTIIYDVLPIYEGGITEMQVKLMGVNPKGVNFVVATPKFNVEVTESSTNDDGAMQSPKYTALEDALTKAEGIYNSRVTKIVLSPDCEFSVHYADGTIYTSDALKGVIVKGDSIVSKSFAKGGTGTRDGEDTDNAMYYSKVAESEAFASTKASERAKAILSEVEKHGVYTNFVTNFDTGNLEYISPMYSFAVDTGTGELIVNGVAYSIEDNIKVLIEEVLKDHGVIQGG